MSTTTERISGVNLVGSSLIEPGEHAVDVVDPARPDVVTARYPSADAALVSAAVTAATEAVQPWNALPIGDREAILFSAAERLLAQQDAIAVTMAREMGKPVSEGVVEVRRSAQILRFFASELRRPIGETYLSDNPATFLYTLREPLGVVALVTPWNFPLAIPTWKTAAAIAYGNTVVLKPASNAPGPAVALALALRSAGLPDGVVNVVSGPGRSTGDALVQHPDVHAVSYTGSNEVGRAVREACGRLGKRAQVELGGQNPALVLADADLGQAATATAVGAFGNAGQKCTSTRRLIAHSSVVESLVALIESEVASVVLGDPREPETTLGPLVTAAAVDEYEAALANAREEGATVVTGGVVEPRLGFYVRPAIVTNVAAGSLLAREEVFGPILGVLTYDDEDEGVELANSVRFGLSAAVFTRDSGAARRVSRALRAGIVRVNAQTAGADVHVPFGGMKESGSGYREQGRAAREFYTELKTVYEDPAPRIKD